MFYNMCRAKIQRATITETQLEYEGSVTIDQDLLDASGMLPGERVQVVNLNNGSRLESYVIPGARGSGVICLNGPAARLGQVGDHVHIIAYSWVDEALAKDWKITTIYVDENNRVVEKQPASR